MLTNLLYSFQSNYIYHVDRKFFPISTLICLMDAYFYTKLILFLVNFYRLFIHNVFPASKLLNFETGSSDTRKIFFVARLS